MTENNRNFSMKITCITCKKVSIINIDSKDYIKFCEGLRVQDAFPYLTECETGIFLSGMCERCIDELLKENEND